MIKRNESELSAVQAVVAVVAHYKKCGFPVRSIFFIRSIIHRFFEIRFIESFTVSVYFMIFEFQSIPRLADSPFLQRKCGPQAPS